MKIILRYKKGNQLIHTYLPLIQISNKTSHNKLQKKRQNNLREKALVWIKKQK